MSHNTLQILMVEDNEAHIELTRRAFAPEGKKFKLITVGALAEARKILKKASPDLMIADYLLPDGKGIELLPGDTDKLTFPIVILTGHGDEKVATAAMKAGALDYIVKTDATLADMPHIIAGILREWQHITKRKQAEKALRQFEHIVSSSTDMMALLDRDFIYLAANPAYLDAFNKVPDDLIGHSVAEVVGQEFFNANIKANAERCLAGEEINYQAWFDFPACEPRYMDVHYYPHTASGNKVTGFAVNARNITGRRQAEQALQQEKNRSRQVIETARDAFVCMDADGIITDWNPQAEETFGWSRKEALGRKLAETIIPPEFREAHTKGMKHFLATGEGPVLNQHVEITALHRDGHTFPVELSIVPVHSNGSVSFNAFVRDISGQVQAREALEKGREQIRASLVGTIVAISRAVGARDPYTAGHQQRVSQLSRAIAQEMGLDSERIDGLRMGATIHDIGKIYLPAEILSKPTKLTGVEYNLVKSHAQVGYDILKDIEFPWPIADIAHQHHERLDGTGYPQGLKGDEICLEARIVAVADVVEAISSHRPYRPSLGMDVALDEIKSKRGQFYDAYATDACLKLFGEKRFSFESK